jgi:DNA-binding NarL/FixJ family response regulator
MTAGAPAPETPETPTAVRVLVADDQRVVRDGLTMLLDLLDTVEVVGAAADGAQAVELARTTDAEVILMDLRMPVLDGTEATKQIVAALPDTAVVILTTYADDDSLLPALAAGARGYLTKDASAEEIEAAILDAHAGRTHLASDVQNRLVELAVSRAAAPAAPGTRPTPDDGLTPRELEVLKLIAAGLSNTDIEQRLVLSHATVKTHINRIFSKIGARDRAQAVRYAYDHGLADD